MCARAWCVCVCVCVVVVCVCATRRSAISHNKSAKDSRKINVIVSSTGAFINEVSGETMEHIPGIVFHASIRLFHLLCAVLLQCTRSTAVKVSVDSFSCTCKPASSSHTRKSYSGSPHSVELAYTSLTHGRACSVRFTRMGTGYAYVLERLTGEIKIETSESRS
jgi:hypothetical protein